MAQLLLAKPVIDKMKITLADRCAKLKIKGILPKMQVILVGENRASVVYTKRKKKFCDEIGAQADILHLDEQTNEETFLSIIKNVSTDPSIHGLFVQLPLPKQLSHIDVGCLIPPHKDIDGFHPQNVYGLMKNAPEMNYFTPCTPKGIITLLEHYNISIEGKEIVIIGRSMIVGKPLALLLTNHNATVTLCHSRSKNMQTITKRADIIFTAIGIANFLDASYINQTGKQIIIDIGINQNNEGKICGDVLFSEVEPLVHAITPVPGGIGPLTVLSLCQNLLQAAEKNI